MEFIINVAPGPLKAPELPLDRRARRSRPTRRQPAVAVRLQEPGRTAYRRNHATSRVIRGRTHRRHGAGQHPHGQQGEGVAALRRGGQEPHQSDRTGGGRHRLHGQTERHAHQRHARGAVGAGDRSNPIVFPEPRYRAAVTAQGSGPTRRSWASCSTTPSSRTRRFWSDTPRS